MTNQQSQAALVEQRAATEQPSPPIQLTSPALRIMLDDRLFERCVQIAKYMSSAHGMLPDHLIGQPHACFAVVNRAIAWNLDPYAVGACTYPTPGGRVGFEGKLVSAVLEASGRLIGGVRHRHLGDWSKIVGKFTMKTSNKGRQYAAPAWKDEDEEGLGVEISAHLRGEGEPRKFEFWLVQAQPRNSTLWATDPRTQIVYLATRRFASLVVPHLFMGLPFDGEAPEGPDAAIDVTHSAGGASATRPKRDDFLGDQTAPARVKDDPSGDGEGGQGDDVTEKGDGDPARKAGPSPDPRHGMTDTERERVEREADAMQRAEREGAARSVGEDGSAPKASAEPTPIRQTPVPLKRDGSADWIKWHTTVASALRDHTTPEARGRFLAVHEPALRNYAEASPQNADTLRKLIEASG